MPTSDRNRAFHGRRPDVGIGPYKGAPVGAANGGPPTSLCPPARRVANGRPYESAFVIPAFPRCRAMTSHALPPARVCSRNTARRWRTLMGCSCRGRHWWPAHVSVPSGAAGGQWPPLQERLRRGARGTDPATAFPISLFPFYLPFSLCTFNKRNAILAS